MQRHATIAVTKRHKRRQKYASYYKGNNVIDLYQPSIWDTWKHIYKDFGSFEAFKKDHTDENGMIVESREIYDFLDDLHEEIMNTEDIGFAEVQSEKHDPLMEFFIGNIVKYDRRIQKND